MQRLFERGKVAWRHAHHGAAIGVEAQRADDGQAGLRGTGHRRLHLFGRGHGLDPQHIGAAFGQRHGLLGKRITCLLEGQWSDRLHDFAGRTHAAGHHHLASAGIGNLARQHGRRAVDLDHAVLPLVQLEPVARAAEAVGQDDVGAGIDKAAVQVADTIRVFEVPQLGRIAGNEADIEQIAAGGAVSQQPGAAGQQAGEAIGDGRGSGDHGSQCVGWAACGQGGNRNGSGLAFGPQRICSGVTITQLRSAVTGWPWACWSTA